MALRFANLGMKGGKQELDEADPPFGEHAARRQIKDQSPLQEVIAGSVLGWCSLLRSSALMWVSIMPG